MNAAEWPRRFKRKLVPPFLSEISSDEVLHWDARLLVTRFDVTRSQMGVSSARSWIFLDENFSATEKYDEAGALNYWYCDLLHVEEDPGDRSLTVTDLIVDVVVFPDGNVQIIDLPELQAIRSSEAWNETFEASMRRGMAKLVDCLLSGDFPPRWALDSCPEQRP